MSKQHPIIAITGSSGAGTSTVGVAMGHIFRRDGINAATVEGDSFHRYNREDMQAQVERVSREGRALSHFGPEGNLFDRLEVLFMEYSERGTGLRRYYLHNREEAEPYGQDMGTFTPWMPLPAGTDLLFYEGLHGGVVTDKVNVARYVDLLIGVVPIVNLEWIQKIHRDTAERGYSPEAVLSAGADGGYLEPFRRPRHSHPGRELCGDPVPGAPQDPSGFQLPAPHDPRCLHVAP